MQEEAAQEHTGEPAKVQGIGVDLYCEFRLINRSSLRLRVGGIHCDHGEWDWDEGGNRPIWPGETKRYTAKDVFGLYGSEGTVTFRDDAGGVFAIRYCCSFGKGGNYAILSRVSPLLDVTLRFANATPPEQATKTWGSAQAPTGGHPLGILVFVEPRAIKTSLKVLTYNTHLFKGSNAAAVQPSLVQKDDERREEILKQVIKTDADVVCLEEVWALDFQREITRKFAEAYPYFYVAPDNTVKTEWWEDWLNWVLPVLLAGITGGWSMFYLIGNVIALGQGYSSLTEMMRNSLSNTSGLLLASRLPLEDLQFTMYEGLSGEDKLAKKGLITFTVMAAVDRDVALPVRMGMTHCPTDITDALRVVQTVAAPKTMQDDHMDRILVGDFNLHFTNKSEYDRLNGVVMGASDVTHTYLPNIEQCYTDWQVGNSLTWLIDSNREPHAPTAGQDRIDYVYQVPRTGGSRWLEPANVSIFHDWDMAYSFTAFGKSFTSLSLSDHYPVVAEFKVVAPTAPPYQGFTVQTRTPLSLGEFESGSYRFSAAAADGHQGICDIYCVKQKNCQTQRVELHVLNARANYEAWKIEVPTALRDPSDLVAYLAGDFHRRGGQDLFVLRAAANTGRLEVHVLDGARDAQYGRFLFQRTTPIERADIPHFDFVLGQFSGGGRPDIYCIKRRSTGSGFVELHVLSGDDEYQSFTFQQRLSLRVQDAEAGKYAFAAGRYRRPMGNADLFLLKRANTASGRMEVSVLNGADRFDSYMLKDCATVLEASDSVNFEFGVGNPSGIGGVDDYGYRRNAALYGVKYRHTGSKQVEIHVLV